jgi:TatD DNase family protein
MLETDAPYLAPEPKRGERNESSYVVYIARKLAELFDCPLEKVEEITDQNALTLFNIRD